MMWSGFTIFLVIVGLWVVISFVLLGIIGFYYDRDSK